MLINLTHSQYCNIFETEKRFILIKYLNHNKILKLWSKMTHYLTKKQDAKKR